jgi:hypothetical protein
MIISNRTEKTIYFNKKEMKLVNQLDFSISNHLNNAVLTFHEQNSNNYIYRPDEYYNVIEDIVPIPAKTSWNYTGDFSYIENSNLFKNRNVDIQFFLSRVEKYVNVLKNKKISVQLSGGLDSSLIIGILKHFGINPILIGMRNDRYEFRTERIIQDEISENIASAIFINDEDYLPFSRLFEVPPHFLPNPSSIFYSSEMAMADKCKEKGIEIVFNGMGLDSILCLEANKLNTKYWHPWMYDNNWFYEYIYSPLGIQFKSGAYSNELVNIIWNLRQGLNEDNDKRWARDFFSGFIPEKLVKYRYKADHAGLLIDGIANSFEEIKNIFEIAYVKTNIERFSNNQFKVLFNNYHRNDDQQIKLILSRVSYAVWINSLMKNELKY